MYRITFLLVPCAIILLCYCLLRRPSLYASICNLCDAGGYNKVFCLCELFKGILALNAQGAKCVPWAAYRHNRNTSSYHLQLASKTPGRDLAAGKHQQGFEDTLGVWQGGPPSIAGITDTLEWTQQNEDQRETLEWTNGIITVINWRNLEMY